MLKKNTHIKKRYTNMEDMRQKETIPERPRTMPLSMKKKLRLIMEIMRNMRKRNNQLDILRYIPISIHVVSFSVY